ncbi:MAG TPA: nuclear transport factor 2 family protein [Streptosporangiaceae bacterium]|nr:nuclear transport factor 2 family protein [Streptosporangiaceae bacterium]
MVDQLLRDRFEIVELCARMGWHLDHCEWDELLVLFTDEISLDYTSLNGGEILRLPSKEVIDKWRANREGLTATQHLIANQIVDIDGDTATATAMFQATHLLPNPYGAPTWTLGGRYRYGLTRTDVGWRISSVAMSIIWADGNRHIRDLALESR